MRLLQQGKKNVQYDHYEACNKRTFIIYLLEITLSQKKKNWSLLWSFQMWGVLNQFMWYIQCAILSWQHSKCWNIASRRFCTNNKKWRIHVVFWRRWEGNCIGCLFVSVTWTIMTVINFCVSYVLSKKGII